MAVEEANDSTDDAKKCTRDERQADLTRTKKKKSTASGNGRQLDIIAIWAFWPHWRVA